MTPKNVVTWMPENSCFRTPFRSQCVDRYLTLLKSQRDHFHYTSPLISYKLSCETSFLVGSEMLGLFFNTLTAYHMYSHENWEKFLQQVQTQLSSNSKTLSEIFMALLKSTRNFAHFQKKVQLHSVNFSKVIDSEECGYWNAKALFSEHPLEVNELTCP